MPEKLKIQLVQPYSQEEDWVVPTIPLGLMYIASSLKQAYGERVDIRLFDMGVGHERFESKEKLETAMKAFVPDIVGIRGMTCQQAEFFVVAKLAKEINPRCLVFAGGPHANAEPAELLAHDCIDYAGVGEGELTMQEVIGKILEKGNFHDTRGLAFKENGKVLFTEPRPLIQDLDTLPFPDYTLIDLDKYQTMPTMTAFFSKEYYTTLFTSRGCPYKCIYCHNIFGKSTRFRSAQNIFDEMVHLHKKNNVTEFHIVDDCFNVNKNRAIETFRLIAESPYKFWIAFPNGIRGDLVDGEFVKWAKAAGTYHVVYAVESASPRIQKLIHKNLNLDKLKKAIELTAREGIFINTFNMIGFPTETEEEMMMTVNYALDSPIHSALFFLVTPFRNTALYDLAIEHGFKPMEEERTLRFHNIVDDSTRWFTRVSRERIQEILQDFNMKFYFDPRRIQDMIDLIPWAHDWDQIGQFMHNRTTQFAGGIENIPDKKARALLWTIMEKAREKNPEAFAELPVRPPETFLSRLKNKISAIRANL